MKCSDFTLRMLIIQSWRSAISHYTNAYMFGPLSLQCSCKTTNPRNIASKDTTLQQVEDEMVLINSLSCIRSNPSHTLTDLNRVKNVSLFIMLMSITVIITVYNTDQSTFMSWYSHTNPKICHLLDDGQKMSVEVNQRLSVPLYLA